MPVNKDFLKYRKKDLWDLIEVLSASYTSNKNGPYANKAFISYLKTIYFKSQKDRYNIDPLSIKEAYREYTSISYEDIPLYITRDDTPDYIKVFLKWRLDKNI